MIVCKCRTCKHFKQTKDSILCDESFGGCVNQIFQAKMNDFPTFTRVLYYDHETGGHHCSFHVHEDFGCIGWEEKS